MSEIDGDTNVTLDLKHYMNNHNITAGFVLKVAHKLAKCLIVLHDMGIVHGQITQHSIYVTEQRQVCLQ